MPRKKTRIKKVLSKPVPVEAVQFCTFQDGEFIVEWLEEHDIKFEERYDPVPGTIRFIEIKTPEGWMTAHRGSWVFKTPQGTFYPLNNDTFEATFDV